MWSLGIWLLLVGVLSIGTWVWSLRSMCTCKCANSTIFFNFVVGVIMYVGVVIRCVGVVIYIRQLLYVYGMVYK